MEPNAALPKLITTFIHPRIVLGFSETICSLLVYALKNWVIRKRARKNDLYSCRHSRSHRTRAKLIPSSDIFEIIANCIQVTSGHPCLAVTMMKCIPLLIISSCLFSSESFASVTWRVKLSYTC